MWLLKEAQSQPKQLEVEEEATAVNLCTKYPDIVLKRYKLNCTVLLFVPQHGDGLAKSNSVKELMLI